MIKLENYGYAMGSPFHQELISSGAGGMSNGSNVNIMGGNEQGLSPPYSNQSPHSVQSNLALSPHAYLGKLKIKQFVVKNS